MSGPASRGRSSPGRNSVPARDRSSINGDGRFDAMLERAPGLGGKVAMPKTALAEGMDATAHIIDSEGNRVGLHTM